MLHHSFIHSSPEPGPWVEKGRQDSEGNGWPGADFQPPLLFLLQLPVVNISCLASLRAHKASGVITEKEDKAGSHIHQEGWCSATLFAG